MTPDHTTAYPHPLPRSMDRPFTRRRRGQGTATRFIPEIRPYALPRADELPDNIAPWTVDPSRAALLVHDMQQFFLRAFPDSTRSALVANCARLRETCRSLGVPVAYTAQPGSMTSEQRGLLNAFWGPGMSGSAAERAIVPELEAGPEDMVFTKWRYSAFHGSDLHAWLYENGREQLIVCGVYAHIGVLATAQDSFSRDFETFFAGDAVADFSRGHHMTALEHAAQNCAVVETTDHFVGQLSAAAPRELAHGRR